MPESEAVRMGRNVQIGDLADVIMETLEDYADLAAEDVKQAVREADPLRLGEELPAADAFEGGKGTEEEPYEIASPEQLALLARKVNEGGFGLPVGPLSPDRGYFP